MNEALSSSVPDENGSPGVMTLGGVPVLAASQLEGNSPHHRAKPCEGRCGMRVAMVQLPDDEHAWMYDVAVKLTGWSGCFPVDEFTVLADRTYSLNRHTVQRCRELRERDTPERGE